MAGDFVQIQSVGRVPAKRASDVEPGDVLMYNFGYTYTVVSVVAKGKSVFITERSDESGREYTRRRVGSTLVAWVPPRAPSASSGTRVLPTATEIERDVASITRGESPGGVEAEEGAEDRLFVGYYPTGVSYADRRRERHGDYLTLARLPYRSLELEWVPHVPVPLALREEIVRHARSLQARRGEDMKISQAGQTVRLGG